MIEHQAFALVDQLLDLRVELAIIGGHAVNVHGHLRATEDVDIVFRRSPATERAIFDALSKFGAYWIGDEVDPDTGIEYSHSITLEYVQSSHLMMLGSDVGWIDLFDFIPGIPGEPVDDLLSTAVMAKGRPFASLPWLKRMKRAADRPQDRLDLENLP